MLCMLSSRFRALTTTSSSLAIALSAAASACDAGIHAAAHRLLPASRDRPSPARLGDIRTLASIIALALSVAMMVGS
jgi:hypothetical protein